MINIRSLFFVFVLFLSNAFLLTIQGQNNNADTADYPHWINMMQDPEANFFETRKAFNIYFENRDITRSPGYKQFKRWEQLIKSRVSPDGKIKSLEKDFINSRNFIASQTKSFKNEAIWTELGPRMIASTHGLGRINAIAFHPYNPDNIYVGAPTGGLWVTFEGGNKWDILTDDLPIRGVSAIIVHYTNPNIIYIGTGDREHSVNGMGVMKTVDRGITWEFTKEGMGDACVNKMLIHNSDPDIIIAATNYGIYKTFNGATSWSLKEWGNFKDLKYKPGDMDKLYATKNGGFYTSDDGGDSWRRTGSDIIPDRGRFVIGVTPANDSIVYVACDDGKFNGLFESRDFGESFIKKSDSPNIMGRSRYGDDHVSQGYYNFCISVDPDNANNILIGGINLWKSYNGGINWQYTGNTNIHVDHHVLEYAPNKRKLYSGNDGGIYASSDNGESWTNGSDGLGISEVYKIGQSATLREKVMNGYQDNGTKTYLGDQLIPWVQQPGGFDGMECIVDHNISAYSYSSSQHGLITRYLNNQDRGRIAGKGINGIDESGAWVTPFCLNETDPNTMIIGYKNLWRSKNIKKYYASDIVWERITPVLGTDNNTISVVESSPANKDLFYFAREDTSFFRSENIMDESPEIPQWDDLTDNLPDSGLVTDIEAHPYDENILFITLSSRVYKSIDKGNNWNDISGSLPDITFYDIAFDKSSIEGLYIAALTGVYFKEGPDFDWIFYGYGLPGNAMVTEIEIFQDQDSRDESRLRIATYGRGLWEAPLGPFSGILPASGLVAESAYGFITLMWRKPFYTNDTEGYNIYRNNEIISFSTEPEFSDSTVINDSTYTYYVKAVNLNGEESERSNIVTAYPKSPKTIPYSQDFENGNDDWEYKNAISGWRLGNAEELTMVNNDGNQTTFFGINSLAAGQSVHVHDSLISPVFDLSTHIYLTLSFDYVLRRFMDFDRLWILYRISKDTEWIEIAELNPTGNWNSWLNFSLDIPAGAISSTTQFLFYYNDNNEIGYGAGIDNFKIFENTTDINDLLTNKQLNIFPNPNSGEFEILFINDNPSDVLLSVYSLEGKKIFERNFEQSASELRERINLSNQPKGIYQLRIISGNKIFNSKIIFQ